MPCSYRYLIGISERLTFFFNTPKHNFSYYAQSPDPRRDPAFLSDVLYSAVASVSLLRGQSVHAHLLKSSPKPCLFLLNNLLNVYCKCGDLICARNLFDEMPKRDVVSWNSLIAGFLHLGLCGESMNVFVKARNHEAQLDKFTYATALSVCARTGDLGAGRMVHGLVVVGGLAKRVFLTNSLIDMYSKCGDVNEARRVFDDSEEVDDVTWNSLISACVRAGLVDETLRAFVRMRQEAVEMNSFALGSVLKACSTSVGDMKEVGIMIHGCVVKVGLESDVFVGSAMLDMYAKKGLLHDAISVFKVMPDPNVVVFNAMIAGFGRSGVDADDKLAGQALCLFSTMLRRGMQPTKFTFSSVLRACNLNEAFEFGKQIQGLIFKHGLQGDEFIGSALIDMYSKSGSIEDGSRCFLASPKCDIVTWTSMISACVENEQFERALSLFSELLSIGRKPDQFTVSSVMSACANLAVARSGEQIQSYASKAGFDGFTICSNAQIFMYARSGDIDAAYRTFEELQTRDVVSWSAMISSHAQHGCARDALLLFEDMEHHRIVPNHIAFLGVLTACSHGGLVDEGLSYFENMREYGILPNVKHCACIVDLLGRAGKLSDAEEFILESGFSDDPVIWRALLGSCRIHKDTERGARVAKCVIELDPDASASYVLLYNMYLDEGSRSMALKARDLMKEKGVKKEPGLSWVEIGARVHSFVAGDKSHPMRDGIYSKLEDMLSKIQKVDHHEAEIIELEDLQVEQNESLMNCHSEKLAVALGILLLPESAPIRVMKNLRICRDCHTTMKLFSGSEGREIVVRDAIRFHRFRNGSCSCGDYW